VSSETTLAEDVESRLHDVNFTAALGDATTNKCANTSTSERCSGQGLGSLSIKEIVDANYFQSGQIEDDAN
jgi:hypothetical protein